MATEAQKAKVLSALKEFKRKYITKRNKDADESATRLMINYFLSEVLGYTEIDEIKTEYNIKGVYADYVVQTLRRKQFVVEVKAMGIDLNDHHLRQSVGYAANEGIDWIVLTNGRTLRFYRVLFEKPIRYELVATIEFTDATPKQLSGYADFLCAFSKRGVEKKEHEMLWSRTTALSTSTISKLMYSNHVVSYLRRELKKSTSINFDEEAIKKAVCNCLEAPVNLEKLKYKSDRVAKH